MEKKPLHEIMAEMLSGSKLTEADNIVGKTDTTIKVDKDVKDPNQEAIDTANIIKSAPTREDPNKDTSEIDDDVDGIADGILVITDPEITSEEFDEVADELQGIVDKSDAGELPFTDKYKGDYILSCPICGGTFVNDTLLDSGEDVCPICCKVPDAFVVSGKIEDAWNAVEKEEVQDDIEQEENVEEPETDIPQEPAPSKEPSDDLEIEDEEDINKKESKSISGNKLQESKDDDEDKEDDDEDEKDNDEEDIKIETEKDAIDFLVNDEEEAIKGYETVLDKLDDLDIEDKDLYKEKIAEIIADEKDHIEILKGLLKGEDISDEDLDNKEELEEGKEMEINAGNIKRKAQEILPKEDIDVHDGDLYLKVSDKSTELVNQMKDKDSGLLKKFKSHIDNEMWYEIPFANMEDDYKEKVQESAVDGAGNLTNYIGKPDENDYVGSVWENNKAYKFDVYKVGDKYVDGNGYEVEPDKVKQLEKKTEDYDEDDTRNKEVINPEDKEYYDGKKWQVRVWCGSGYMLDYFNLYHDGQDTENMLCKVVAYAENNDPDILLKVDDIMEEINTLWEDEYKEWAEDNGEDEFQFATDYLDLVYVDATEEGASQPYFIRGENLAILDFDMNESKLEEDVNSDVLSKAEQLGKQAFENGMKRIPAQDKELVDLLDGIAIGDGGKVLDAWLNAWDKANTSAPINEEKELVTEDIDTNKTVSAKSIKEAEKFLMKYDFDEDDAYTVLQAIGYTLLDWELYPEDEDIVDVDISTTINDISISKSKEVLIDNGIDKDNVLSVLQSLGQILLGIDLFSNLKEEKEIKTESKLVWQSSDDGTDEEGFWEWLEEYQDLDEQVQERVFEIEEQTEQEATEEDIEQIRNEIADSYREEYYDTLNSQLLEDWEDNIKPMLENQLDETDTLICMGTANTWDRSGSAYRICDGINELQNIMGDNDYNYIALYQEDTGLRMDFGHHDGTHRMYLYTLASTPEMIFETLYDKQSPIVTGYEDFDDYLSEHYEGDIVEDLLDNAQDNQDVLEKVLKPLVNLL